MVLLVTEYVFLILFGYFVGNISWSRIIAKSKNVDITKQGSGNPGATNMLRTFGAKIGFLVLLLDAIKGLVPALVGRLLFKFTGLNQDIGLFVAGLSAIIGHMFPIIYKFKGGKSVSTTIGVFMVANPLWLIVAFAIGFLYVWLFDYVSVASLFIVAFMSGIQGYFYSKPDYYGNNLAVLIALNSMMFIIFGLVWFAHRKNIARLLLGKENKANLQKSLRKQISKQQREEYKEQKSQLRQEVKKLRAEYRKDAREKKKSLKTEYKSAKENLTGTNADILASQISQTEMNNEEFVKDKIEQDENGENIDGEK